MHMHTTKLNLTQPRTPAGMGQRNLALYVHDPMHSHYDRERGDIDLWMDELALWSNCDGPSPA
jgi:hypothetical protein